MSWARFDDLYDDHPKVMAVTHANPLAAALHPQAITAAARRESDGLVDQYWLLAKVPEKRKRDAALTALVALRLFDVLAPGEQRTLRDQKGFEVTVGPFPEARYMVHDYLDYNFSSAQLADRRAKDAARKADGRQKESAQSPDRVRADSERRLTSLASAPAGPRPVPSRPNPSSLSSPSSDQEPHSVGEEVHPDVDRLCHLLAELMLANDPKAKVAPDSARWRDACRLLLERDERPVAEVERILRWSQADEFWRTNILSMPKLREQFGQLKLKMEAAGVRDAFGQAPPASSAQLGAALSRPSRTGVRP